MAGLPFAASHCFTLGPAPQGPVGTDWGRLAPGGKVNCLREEGHLAQSRLLCLTGRLGAPR